jgi:hypothetical protein
MATEDTRIVLRGEQNGSTDDLIVDHPATGAELPADASTIRYAQPDAGWDFDYDDRTKMARRLPRLTALCWPEATHSLESRWPDRAHLLDCRSGG